MAGDPARGARSGMAGSGSSRRGGSPGGGGLIPGSVGDRLMNGGRGSVALRQGDPGDYDSTRKDLAGQGEEVGSGEVGSMVAENAGGGGVGAGSGGVGANPDGVGGPAASGGAPGGASSASNGSPSGSTGGEAGMVGLGEESSGGGLGAGGGGGGGEGGGSGASGGGIRFRPRRTIDLTLACGRDDIEVQPGGYRLKVGDPRLVETLREIVRRRERAYPDAEIRPQLTYLVEPGGESTYWAARRSTVLVGLGWPARLRISEGSPLRLAVGGEPR
jgi:hypothetical protein